MMHKAASIRERRVQRDPCGPGGPPYFDLRHFAFACAQALFALLAICQWLPGAAAAQIFHSTPGATRKPDQTIAEAAPAPISALSYSADGSTLTITAAGKAVDLKTGDSTRTPPTKPLTQARCTGQKLNLLDAASGETRQTFALSGPCVAATSLDGKLLAAALPNGAVKLWTVDPEAPPREWTAHRQSVHALAFSLDGVQLATASADGAIKIWDTKTGELLSTLEGHTAPVLCIAFSPNGRTIASGGADRTVRYWTMPLPPIPPDDLRGIEAAVQSTAGAAPKKPRKVLVFWRADAIQHKTGVPAVNAAIELLAKRTGAFQVDFSRDYDVLDLAILSKYDAVIMNSTTHLAIPDDAKKKAFLDYVKGGGGVIGIHAAIDTFKDWPAGAEVIGATFGGHPFVPTGYWSVKIEEPDHRLTRAFAGKGFVVHDEIYEMCVHYTRDD